MRWILFYGGLSVPLLFASTAANAAIEPAGLLDEVADRFLAASSSWAGTITDAASWLFWTLVVISMVWTFGMMALRKADLGEFFAEFARFTITTGFFWWLLRNGPKFAMDIINSMRTLAAQASGQARELTPSRTVDIGWDVVVKAADNYSVLSPIDNLSIFLITAAILACMAVVGANVLITLVNAWILAYAGIFVLGFGGARWTSDIAINYFRSVLGIGLKLLTITLLVGIAVSIMDSYYANLSQGAPVRELLLVFVVALVLTLLIHSVPNVIAGLVPGGAAATGIGSFSTGAIVGAGMATAGMAAQAVAAAASGGALWLRRPPVVRRRSWRPRRRPQRPPTAAIFPVRSAAAAKLAAVLLAVVVAVVVVASRAVVKRQWRRPQATAAAAHAAALAAVASLARPGKRAELRQARSPTSPKASARWRLRRPAAWPTWPRAGLQRQPAASSPRRSRRPAAGPMATPFPARMTTRRQQPEMTRWPRL